MTSRLVFFIRAAILTLLIIFTWMIFSNHPDKANVENKSFSSFYDAMTKRQIKSVTIVGHRLTGEDIRGKKLKTILPPHTGYDLAKELQQNGVAVKIDVESDFSVLGFLWPLLLFLGLCFMLTRHVRQNPFLKLAGARSKRFEKEKQKITFEDVAGVEEAKEELREIIAFLKDPQKFHKLGGRVPKGVLLVGPPGTGKTLLARAVAGEAGVPFFTISGSDFVEVYVGVGASRVRNLFRQGEKFAPCIIFLDEIDAVGRRRGTGIGGGHDEREQTLNQLLVEMDGFQTHDGVIIIAASNRPDVLDPALLRPGRFDRHVTIPLPDIKGREAILKVHAGGKPFEPNVDMAIIARGTPGFSGADLANLINEAALNAAKFERELITCADLEEAKDRPLMGGLARRSMVISEEQKKRTAYHEAGHVLVAYFLPDADPLHKVSIIPRGPALGMTIQLPMEDTYHWTLETAEARIAICMGGRCAEKIFLHLETSGCSRDFEQATEIAKNMVTRWGMSKLGPRVFGETGEQPFLGMTLTRAEGYSDFLAQKIDETIDEILNHGRQRAEKILTASQPEMEKIVRALLEHETLNIDEITAILGPRPHLQT